MIIKPLLQWRSQASEGSGNTMLALAPAGL